VSIEYLPHTADVRMKIRAKSLGDLFVTGLEGMNKLLKEGFCRQKSNFSKSHRIHIQSNDMTLLLIDFLSEVLTYTHSEKSIFCKVEIIDLKLHEIEVFIYGMSVNDGFDEDIKAVTYHEAEVLQTKDGDWETVVIFDI
jgi:SHS2 domain-containing protein